MMLTRPILTPCPGQPVPIDVLVVDDVAENRVAMAALLERPGVRVLTAATGNDALEILLRHEVALALLDVQMPGMDGFELAELMRGSARTRDVPIIFLTATDRDPVRHFRGYEAGAVDFLYKPVDPRIVSGKVAVFVELHQQRRTLAEHNAALTRALELNELMTAVLAHDLRAPLAAVMAGAEAAALASESDRNTARALQAIRRGGQRMDRMISDLLDFSRIRSGQLKLVPEYQDVGTILDTVVDELRAAHGDARITVDRRGDTRGRCDGGRMAQVFANLIGNALVHGSDGQVTVTLDGTAADHLRAEIRNPGALPADGRDRLFEPFGGSGSRRGSGLGLGLFIARQFVIAHGGELSGDSVGEQTCFRLQVPRDAGGE